MSAVAGSPLSVPHQLCDDDGVWSARHVEPHSRVELHVDVCTSAYEQLRLPVPKSVVGTKVSAMVDTGAQMCVADESVARRLGIRDQLVDTAMNVTVADNERLGILGASFVVLRMAGGRMSRQMVYFARGVGDFYLSKSASRDLGIIPVDFPASSTTRRPPTGSPELGTKGGHLQPTGVYGLGACTSSNAVLPRHDAVDAGDARRGERRVQDAVEQDNMMPHKFRCPSIPEVTTVPPGVVSKGAVRQGLPDVIVKDIQQAQPSLSQESPSNHLAWSAVAPSPPLPPSLQPQVLGDMTTCEDVGPEWYLETGGSQPVPGVWPPGGGAGLCATQVQKFDAKGRVLAECGCLLRTAPPRVPEFPPFDVKPENVSLMEQWFLDTYASSSFNNCPHQMLPLMSGLPPLRILTRDEVEPKVVHRPATVPAHWMAKVREDLERDIALGVLERVPQNTAVTWCARMHVVGKKTASLAAWWICVG